MEERACTNQTIMQMERFCLGGLGVRHLSETRDRADTTCTSRLDTTPILQ